MAIDYKKEWIKLQDTYGNHPIQDYLGKSVIPTSLCEIMNFQIQHTIQAREKLMEEYVKENITTEINGEAKDFHYVNIVYKEAFRDRISVHKDVFDVWCKKKGGK